MVQAPEPEGPRSSLIPPRGLYQSIAAWAADLMAAAVLLGVTMWLQFRLNPAPTDPIQAQVFAIMPWMLMFVMAPFAAGLLVYWITNNVLTMAQQQWLYRRYPEMKAAVATPVKAK